MASPQQVSDLVTDSKLDTIFNGNLTTHSIKVVGVNVRRRPTKQEQVWRREKKPLGEGSSGIVWHERLSAGPSTCQERAVKVIRKRLQNSNAFQFSRELEAIAKFSHPKYNDCFVQSFGWFEDDVSIYIAMEYFPCGDLQGYMSSSLLEADAQEIASQVLEGLAYMHGNGFAHRDLNPRNILVKNPGPEWWVKIGDFGISKRAIEAGTALRTLTGTQGFMAPEIYIIAGHFDCEDVEEYSDYSVAVDIWSLGEIIFRALTKQAPFPKPRDLGAYINSTLKFPRNQLVARNVSANGCSFVVDLMKPKPKDRPAAAAALDHPWLNLASINTQSSNQGLYEPGKSSPDDIHEAFAETVRLTTSEGQPLIPQDTACWTDLDIKETTTALRSSIDKSSPAGKEQSPSRGDVDETQKRTREFPSTDALNAENDILKSHVQDTSSKDGNSNMDRWAQIRKRANERAARQGKESGSDDEESIADRVTRIKARVAELVGEPKQPSQREVPSPQTTNLEQHELSHERSFLPEQPGEGNDKSHTSKARLTKETGEQHHIPQRHKPVYNMDPGYNESDEGFFHPRIPDEKDEKLRTANEQREVSLVTHSNPDDLIAAAHWKSLNGTESTLQAEDKAKVNENVDEKPQSLPAQDRQPDGSDGSINKEIRNMLPSTYDTRNIESAFISAKLPISISDSMIESFRSKYHGLTTLKRRQGVSIKIMTASEVHWHIVETMNNLQKLHGTRWKLTGRGIVRGGHAFCVRENRGGLRSHCAHVDCDRIHILIETKEVSGNSTQRWWIRMRVDTVSNMNPALWGEFSIWFSEEVFKDLEKRILKYIDERDRNRNGSIEEQ